MPWSGGWTEQPNLILSLSMLADWLIGLEFLHHVGSDLSYWVITESRKIISKTSVKHVTQDDYLQANMKAHIDQFNQRLGESLDDANFAVKGKGEFESMYLDDINDDNNPRIHHRDDTHAPMGDKQV